MRLVYYDESGDDGYPEYSSPLFCLSAVYLHYLSWKESFESILQFRRELKREFNLPVKIEMHTKQFLLDKNPYREFGFTPRQKIQMLKKFCSTIAKLDIRIINVVIAKPRLKSQHFDVLDTALTYSIQRVENDLKSGNNSSSRFMIITDPGRLSKMRSITRRIQRINYIPSKYGNLNYRSEIKCLIEDPLPKDSEESYFIQIADMVAYLVNLYSLKTSGLGTLPNRLSNYASFEDILDCLTTLKPVLNLQASSANEYGIVYHPKK